MNRTLCFTVICAFGGSVIAVEPVAKPASPNPLVKALLPVPQGIRVDLAGDPMPPGMVQRLGGTRFKVPGWWRQFGFAGNDEWIWMKADNQLSLIHRESGRVIKQPQMRLGTDHTWNLSVGGNGNRVAIDLSDFRPDANKETAVRVVIVSALTTSQIREITWKSQTHSLSSVSLSQNGERLLTVTHGGELRVWNIETGELLTKRLLDKPANLKSVAFSADGRFAVLVSHGSSFFWNVEDGDKIAQLPVRGTQAACIAPSNQIFATIGDDGVKIFDTETVTPTNLVAVKDRFSGNADFGVSFSSDSKLIAIPMHTDNLVKVWNVESKECIASLPASQPRGAVFSRDGHWIAVAGNDSTTAIFDWPGQKQLSQPTEGHEDGVLSLCFIDDHCLVSSCRNARVWDIDSGHQLNVLAHTNDTHIRGLTKSPKGDRLITMAFDDSIGLWDRETGKRLATLPGHGRYGSVRLARFLPDGSQFISWGDDTALRRWHTNDGHLIDAHDLDLPDYKSDPEQPRHFARAQALTADTLFVAYKHNFFEYDLMTAKQ